MSKKSRAAGAATVVAMLSMFSAAGQAAAEPSPVHQVRPVQDPMVSECLAPIQTPPRSPDVLQGWIDGCRTAQAARTAASLGDYL
jgi:hypothetical protein